MKRLTNRVMLITGASSGIGQQIAISAASEGAQLILVARRRSELTRLANILNESFNTKVLIIISDLMVPIQIDRTIEKALDYFGSIDVLVNTAGYGDFKPASEFTYEEIEAMFRLNTFAMMHLSKLVSNSMQKKKAGHIFFIASIAGKLATPSSGVYSATKSAIISYANALRLEVARYNIKVTTVNPGPVATPFFTRTTALNNYYQRINRYTLNPRDVAGAVIEAIIKPRRDITQPWMLKWGSRLNQLSPVIGDYLILNVFNYKEDRE